MTYAAASLHQTDDRAGLQALWREVMAGRTGEGVADWRFSWFFGRNPAGAPATCVTHHVESKALVACASAYARRVQAAGALHMAGNLCDFGVAKQHRVAGAALAVQRQLMTESLQRFAFIYGCPNKAAEPIFKRLGYTPVANTVSYARPLRTRHWIAKTLTQPAAAWLVSTVADNLLAASDVRARLGRPFAWRTEELARADERFDALWERARRHYGITGERSAAYLNWRYADFLTRRHRFFCVSERRTGALVGYVIYTVERDLVLIADLFCDDPGRLLTPLLLRFVAAMRDGKHRSIYVTLVADRATQQSLTHALFVKRPDSKQLIARAHADAPAELAAQLADGQRWFLVGGELDT